MFGVRKSFRNRVLGEQEITSEPNLTPLIDVCLVLVIIFMVTAPMVMQAGIKILESQAGAGSGKHAAEENIEVILTEDDKVMLNGQEVLWQDFPLKIRQEIYKSRDKLVFVTADNKNRVGRVVEILDISKQQGAKKVAIISKAEGV
ncbi:biopolymer transporter ExbD [Candidatus Desantisbacteria bacterium]|nr:biopolymer transporter ExbD [Candidatus Desantisbacteria bacterium]